MGLGAGEQNQTEELDGAGAGDELDEIKDGVMRGE
jgi:hypothetical protein